MNLLGDQFIGIHQHCVYGENRPETIINLAWIFRRVSPGKTRKRLINQAQCYCHLVRCLCASWLCIHKCQFWGGHPASLSLSMSHIWCSHVRFGQAKMKKVAQSSVDSLFTLHRGRQRDMMCQSLLSTWCICILQCWKDPEGTAWQDTSL